MLDQDVYLQGLLEQIEVLKSRGRRSLYRMNDEVSQEIIDYAEEYIKSNTDYKITIKKCLLYENSFDVMIVFRED